MDIKYSIAEASERLKVSYRTLHYYESKFGLFIERDGAGNRVYSEYNIELLEKIIELKGKGLTLDGIKNLLLDKGIIDPENEDIVVIDEKVMDAKEFLINEIRDSIAKQIQLELRDTKDKLDEIIQENEELRNEIKELKYASEKHYKLIDEKITSWRESKDRPWYKNIFNKNK